MYNTNWKDAKATTKIRYCDAYTFKSGYSSGYISFFASQGSKKWVIESFHRSNEFDNTLALAHEKAGILFRNRKREALMDSNLCSYCGGHDLTITNKDYTLSEPYGGEALIQVHVCVCNTCGFTEDDSDYNDPLILEGLAVLKRQSMVNVLTELNSLGFSNASMERTLGLPARTLARWKNETSLNPSAAALALMKIIRTFPWILAVADQRYDAKSAQSMVLQQAFSSLLESFSNAGDTDLLQRIIVKKEEPCLA